MKKHQKVTVYVGPDILKGIEEIRKALEGSGSDALSRSEIIRLLISKGALDLMGDREKTMRECVTDPAEDERAEREEASRRGRRSRNKGASFERQCVKDLRERLPGETVRRSLQSRGAELADVEAPYFWIECKAGRKPNPRAALAQAIRDAEESGKVPIAVIKDDRRDPFVLLQWEDWLDFIEEYHEAISR